MLITEDYPKNFRQIKVSAQPKPIMNIRDVHEYQEVIALSMLNASILLIVGPLLIAIQS